MLKSGQSFAGDTLQLLFNIDPGVFRGDVRVRDMNTVPGQAKYLTMTPDPGAVLVSVTVDGRNVGAVTSYTFRNVSGAHTISAQFRKSSYTITSSCNSGGTIGPKGTRQIAYNGSQTYTVSPNSGFRISDVLVDGVSVGATGRYTFSSVRDDHTIEAVFERTNWTIRASAGTGGSISPSGSVSVRTGSDYTFTITPDAGWIVSSVTVDGANAGRVTSYTFTNVREAHTISTSFSRLSYAVTASAGQGGQHQSHRHHERGLRRQRFLRDHALKRV